MRRPRPPVRLALLAAAIGLRALPAAAAPPNVVFVLLDATRADRFGAWGNPNRPTPSLDALAAAGVAFKEHFANAHATRASMPQIMTGRYYGQSILRPFLPDRHPREMTFSRPDRTAALLPGILRRHGYQALGVSAHPWVVAESDFGHEFQRLDFVGADPHRGHADAVNVIDRALDAWRTRDRGQPLFLYVHLMDMHMPRFLPEAEPRFPVPGFAWRERFEPGGEPIFNRAARRWAINDGRGFTELDRRHFAGVYDTRLSYADEHLGRLLGALRAEDPELGETLVVVVADHGEELGEDGRTDHLDSLADAVQHIPWIVAGAGVKPAQEVLRFTENVDVLPTILGVLHLALPPGVRVDGRAQIAGDGRVCTACGKAVVYYAYEDYRAVRTARYLLRQRHEGSIEARCSGADTLYRHSGLVRHVLDESVRHARVAARLRRLVARRLGPLEHAFLTGRYAQPAASFLVTRDYWALAPDARVACVHVDEDTGRFALWQRGWLWSGRGVGVLHAGGDTPLTVAVPAPDGDYRVEAGVVPVGSPPWFSGFGRWRARAFLPDDPQSFLPLGEFHATNGTVTVPIAAAAGLGNHVVALRLSPSAVAPTAPLGPGDDELRQRLKALGYVQ